MKRGIISIVIFLTILSGLFAKPKQLFYKKTDNSILKLEYDNSEDYKYCLTTYDFFVFEERNMRMILSNNEASIKKFLKYLLNNNLEGIYSPSVVSYEFANDDLTKFSEDIEIDSKNNCIVNKYKYILD